MRSFIRGAVKACLFTLGLMGMGSANAVSVTLDENGLNYLELQFTVPVQPAQHNALLILASSFSSTNPPFAATASLYDGGTLLAQSQTTSAGERYSTTSSVNAGAHPIIDYTTIADGTIDGIFTLFVTSGSIGFLTENFTVSTFGETGNLGFNGTVTNVSVSRESPVIVPIPAAVWLFGSGLLGLVGVARRKKAA